MFCGTIVSHGQGYDISFIPLSKTPGVKIPPIAPPQTAINGSECGWHYRRFGDEIQTLCI